MQHGKRNILATLTIFNDLHPSVSWGDLLMLFLSHRLPPVRCLYKELITKVSKKIETTKKYLQIMDLYNLMPLIALSC